MKIENLENAMNELFDFITSTPSGLDGFESDFDAAFRELEKVKSDDVEEVIHAKWVYNPNGMDWGLGAWQCSNCGYVNTSFGMDNRIHAKFYAGSKRCGSCEAKMDLE